MPVQDATIRAIIDAELLSRPPLDITPPARVYHQAFLCDRDTKLHQLIAPILDTEGLDAADSGARQVIRSLDHGTLKWERHGEYETLTVVETAPHTDPIWVDKLADNVANAPHGRRIAAASLNIKPFDKTPMILADKRPSAASRLIDDQAMVFVHYPPDADGFTHMYLHLKPMYADRAGRLVQRLLEIETYRYLALISFPLAQDAQQELRSLNLALDEKIAALDSKDGQQANEAMLADIQTLLQRAAVLKTQTSFRFAATRAYHAILQKRLAEIREDRLDGFSRLATFLGRRIQPAIDLCAATERQQLGLDERLTQAAQILRTRVELGLAHQNQDLLAQLKSSADVQIQLQKSVEGFSVVAISYYLVGLIAIFLKGGEKAGWFTGWELYEAIVAPIAIGFVIWRLRHVMRKHHTGKS